MKKQLLSALVLMFTGFFAFSQVQIDRPIDLNSATPANARIMGIKEVSAPQDAVSAEKLQSGSLVYALSAGTSSAYTLTLAPVLGTYTTGMEIRFKAHTANTAGPVTLNVNALGAKTIKKDVGTDLAANDIKIDQLVTVAYDGTNFQLISRTTDANSGGTVTNVTGTLPISVSNGSTTPVVSIAAATASAAGSMSAADKAKLDAITGTNTGDQTNITGNAGTVTNGFYTTSSLAGDVTGNPGTNTIGTGKVTSTHILDGTIVNADILNVDASKMTTGILTVPRGGTGVGTLTGLAKGNGASAFTAAVAGTDFVAPNAAITGATNTKITYDAKGLVTSGTSLVAGDIPNLDAAKITSGVLPVARGGTGSATQNWVDLTTAQTVGGAKTWSAAAVFSNGLVSSTSISAAGTIVNGGFDFVLGTTDQSSRGNSGASRALVKNGGNVLTVNYAGDFTGGTQVNSNLAVTGAYQGKVRATMVNANFTMDLNDFIVINTGTTLSANRTLTLPTLTSGTTDGRIIHLLNMSTSGSYGYTITAAGGNTVRFSYGYVNPLAYRESVSFVSSGTTWYMIGWAQ